MLHIFQLHALEGRPEKIDLSLYNEGISVEKFKF